MTTGRTTRDAAIAAARRSIPARSPLHVASNGCWAKKIRGKRCYFGSVLTTTHAEALAQYRREANDLHAGRTPVATPDENTTTVDHVLRGYALDLRERAAAGEITSAYAGNTIRCLEVAGPPLGPDTPISKLGPRDFEAVRRELTARNFAAASKADVVRAVRAAFNWAVDEGALIREKPNYGRRFRIPSRAEMRRERAKKAAAGGGFVPSELLRLILSGMPAVPKTEDERRKPEIPPLPDGYLRAGIMLGINAGFGQGDVSGLRRSFIHLDRKLIAYARPKSGVARVIILWPETVDAIKGALAQMPPDRDRDPSARGLAFCSSKGLPLVTRKLSDEPAGPNAASTVKMSKTDSLGLAWNRRATSIFTRSGKVKPPRLGFYALRHTFTTVASRAGYIIETKLALGHVTDNDITLSYVEIGDPTESIDPGLIESATRLSDAVREWALPALHR